ncbi:hypothetical protein Gohar_022156 [Gossypium harknessii]|uniref:Uncharacterized protein n=1 Tax=Gossypium harknessii TaxID=34285 RepID=A0A7J9IAH8_9ROSI|nr:hypothetical protein [Gossypium harknessii]
MWQKTSIAGRGMVGVCLKRPHPLKNQWQLQLVGGVATIVLAIQLHMEMMLDGNGLRILDWIVSVLGEFSHLVPRHL